MRIKFPKRKFFSYVLLSKEELSQCCIKSSLSLQIGAIGFIVAEMLKFHQKINLDAKGRADDLENFVTKKKPKKVSASKEPTIIEQESSKEAMNIDPSGKKEKTLKELSKNVPTSVKQASISSFIEVRKN